MSLETPFNMIILGTTGCGKTYFLLDLLEKEYQGHIDFIYLLCPTVIWNKTYQSRRYVNDPDFVVIDCDNDQVEQYLKQITYVAEGTNSLIILDDVASSQSVKNRTTELVRLGFSGRHYGFSVIVLTQQLISKPFREQISKLVSFYNQATRA